MQISNKIERTVVSLPKMSDHKYWWSGKTLLVLSKYFLKPGSFFIKFLTKVESWKNETVRVSKVVCSTAR